MKLKIPITIAALAMRIAVPSANAQGSVPVRTLSSPEAVTVLPFGAIESVRPLNKGGVLVNDSGRHQLVALDSTLSASTITLDSASQSGLRYGTTTGTLVPWLADSTLFRDVTTQKYFVIDPNGDIVHRLERSTPGQAQMMLTAPRGHDAIGNLIMPGFPTFGHNLNFGSATSSMQMTVVRANFETRQYDELAKVSATSQDRVSFTTGRDGARQARRTINPMPIVDDWTVLSDGTLAVMRADDYRVEMIDPSNQKRLVVKLPFDKKRLTDDEKRQVIDSATTAVQKEAAQEESSTALRQMATMSALTAIGMDSVRKIGRASDGAFNVSGLPPPMPLTTVEFIPLREMPNHLPPFRFGQSKPDADANLWIATNNRLPGNPTESIYDVVNNRAELVQRVRVAAGRTVVGFARGGVVYLKYRNADGLWMLERVRLQN